MPLRLGFAVTISQDVSGAQAGHLKRREGADDCDELQRALVRKIVPAELKEKLRLWLLDFDARIDSTLFSTGKGARELYERYSTFMDRFYVGRWKRWVFIEPLSEAATLGLGGLVLMLAQRNQNVSSNGIPT